MNIRQVSIHLIKPYENNVKVHPVRQIESIVQSIKTFGFRQPLVLDKNNIIVAGHARYEAAVTLGMESVPCEMAEDLSPGQINAYRILDNEIAKQGTTDNDKLHLELEKLPDFDFEPFNINFPTFETINEGLCDDDDVPIVDSDPITVRGDVWVLGMHRLCCGDSTSIEDVDKLMNGEKADMVFTDPPYGVNFEQGKFIGEDKKGKNRHFDPIENDDKKGIDLKEFVRSCLSNALLNCNTASIYIWSPPLLEGFYIVSAAIETGWHIQSQIIWNKTPFVIGRADYHWKHEVCWYGYVGQSHPWFGGRDKSTVWDCAKIQSSDLHPTMKPVQLAENAISNSTAPDYIVLDLFGGSGSTLIACEKTNRKCFMMEISPQYCDVIIKRWQKFTGKSATLESNGKSFGEISNG